MDAFKERAVRHALKTIQTTGVANMIGFAWVTENEMRNLANEYGLSYKPMKTDFGYWVTKFK